MGREVRGVPKYWEHPKNIDGNYKPLFGFGFHKVLYEWEEGKKNWIKGFRRNINSKENPDEWIPVEEEYKEIEWEEWSSEKPKNENYMPEWKEEEKTHIQMYETTSEGTPISPVFEYKEDLAQWLSTNKASAFGEMTATFDEWMKTINKGYSPSAFLGPDGIISGVEFISKINT